MVRRITILLRRLRRFSVYLDWQPRLLTGLTENVLWPSASTGPLRFPTCEGPGYPSVSQQDAAPSTEGKKHVINTDMTGLGGSSNPWQKTLCIPNDFFLALFVALQTAPGS